VPPLPEWYDHHLDVQWGWRARGASFFLERGVFSNLAIELGSRVLDLCCGDGFNARHFYAERASLVLAVDFDPEAIAHAQHVNAAPGVEFRVADIRVELPQGTFDNVVWDAAIEHFTEEEIAMILGEVRQRLRPGGVLSGYTIVERGGGSKHLPHHEREFSGPADLLSFLEHAFKHVVVFRIEHHERTNLYFYASDDRASLPFGSGHPRFTSAHRTV
jgi:SAM-dependent methyltransferase